MLKDAHEGLTKQGDRLSEMLSKSSEQLRSMVEGGSIKSAAKLPNVSMRDSKKPTILSSM